MSTPNRIANAVAGRMSLRAPQRESLEILARICEIADLNGEASAEELLSVIQGEFSSVTDFEREFPSLCFSLATGVGKTRLMGAFIVWLFLSGKSRHFFVLAPNLTIYNKLIADFTPGTPKYVFQGVGEFATRPPTIITGDNYESGLGVRHSLFDDVHINIFNISKINTEMRGGSSPRIKRLSEYIGQSYFDYLAGLDDLVLLMDESHRYRADAGVRAINELRPILGLELTATPFVEGKGKGKRGDFKNVIYSYPLSSAMADGFVKEPAVATRENFREENYTPEELERLKLEDGVRIHENTKVELEIYARANDLPVVKPFMLVVAQDTTHANELVELIRSEHFFDGRYRDKVITVHSAMRGEEKDDTVERLLSVENPAEPTEIVVHVNMLKEGWDVTNLYTIVPLRAANSKLLVEQSIGRGLRLPYGRRTGVSAVDRLTVVAHDRFQEIIDDVNRPDSIIRTGVVIGRDILGTDKQAVTVYSAIQDLVQPRVERGEGEVVEGGDGEQEPLIFATPREQQVAQKVLEVITRYESLPNSTELQRPEIQREITRTVELELAPMQVELDMEPDGDVEGGSTVRPNIEAIVGKTTELFIRHSIDIPRIVLQPTGEITSGYYDFDLETEGIGLQPVPTEILIQHLRTNERSRLLEGNGTTQEIRPEDYLVRALIDYDDISYDQTSDLLYKLAGQVVEHLHSYLASDDDVQNVLQYHQRTLANLIHGQMVEHFWQKAGGYTAYVSKGFTTLRDGNWSIAADEKIRNFRAPVDNKFYIKGMLFGGFRRCCYGYQKFDSDSERRFAVLLEDDAMVEKWLRPAYGQLRLYYNHDREYLPDFVVETAAEKFLVEIKRAADMDEAEVQAKARAAAEWCRSATLHELEQGGKPWRYLLVPHDAVKASATLAGLAAVNWNPVAQLS